MCTDRANLRRLLAYYDMAAVRALPDAVALTREYKLILHIREQLTVACLVLLLDSSNLLEQECDIVKTFLACFLGKGCIHIGPLIVLALSCRLQIFCRRADAVVEQLEPDLCMLLLVSCSLFKDLRDLNITIFLCLGCKIEVLGMCHGFARKCGLEICLRLTAL